MKRLDLAGIKESAPLTPDEIDITLDKTVREVDAPAEQERVLKTAEIGIPEDAPVSLDPERLCLGSLMRCRVENRQILDGQVIGIAGEKSPADTARIE
jgi:hypothetical protein